METLAKFLNAGAKAVRDVSDTTKIILHLDEAGNNNRYCKLLDGCEEYNVDYDVIGLSYYPYWTRNSVEQIIPWCNDLYAKYGNKIMFMETGYNWKPTVPDGSKPGQLVDNGNESHASTPQGQKEFMDELFNINNLKETDDGTIVVTRTGYTSANDKLKIKSGEISSIELSLKKKSSSSSGGSSSGNSDSSTIQDDSVDRSNT